MDFVTWVLLRLDSLIATAGKNRKCDPKPVPKPNRDLILPFGAVEPRKRTGDASPPRPAA